MVALDARASARSARDRVMSTDPKHAEHSASWTFLSNHAHVLLCIARDRDVRLRDVAADVGITERAVQKIVSDLEEAGVIHRTRDGRRNDYDLDLNLPLRHPLEAEQTVKSLLLALLTPAQALVLEGVRRE